MGRREQHKWTEHHKAGEHASRPENPSAWAGAPENATREAWREQAVSVDGEALRVVGLRRMDMFI